MARTFRATMYWQDGFRLEELVGAAATGSTTTTTIIIIVFVVV